MTWLSMMCGDIHSIDFTADVVSTCDTDTVLLNLKPLPDSLGYAFLHLNEPLPIIVASDLNQTQ